MLNVIHDLGKAVLVFHGPRDQVVNVDNARRIFEAARHPKGFVSLNDADHLLSREEDAVYVARVLAAWATRYLRTRDPPPMGWGHRSDGCAVFGGTESAEVPAITGRRVAPRRRERFDRLHPDGPEREREIRSQSW